MQWSSYSYKETEDGVVILEYIPQNDGEQEAESLVIPSYIHEKPVIAIGEDAFTESGMNLQRIEVPGTVKKFCRGAFRMCMSLTELILQEGLEEIQEDAFYLTPLERLTFPMSLCRLEKAWELGSLTWNIPEHHPCFKTDGYGLYWRERPDQDWTLVVVNQNDERSAYRVPDGTCAIGENAFSGQNYIETLEIPGSVKVIGDAALENCQKLEHVILEEGIEEIAQNAFSHCIRLFRIHLPASLKKLGLHALSDTFGWSDSLNGIESITVAENSPYFEADGSALYQLSAPGERWIVKYFGTSRGYKIPGDVTRILSSAFRRATFHELSVPESVQVVDKGAFRECRNLETIWMEETSAKLYVPRNPVYRKDEIMDLFQGSERVRHKLNQEYIATIPEKWKGFSENVTYYKVENLEDAHDMGYVYDYAGYDLLFDTYLNLPDRIGMACCRMHDPIALSGYFREKYETFFRVNQEDIMRDLADREDMDMLSAMAGIGCFTGENIEACIDVISRTGKTKLVGYLLDYKREHLGFDAFDFSL